MNAAYLTRSLKAEAQRLGFDLTGVCPAVSPTGLSQFHAWLTAGYAGEMHYLARRKEAYAHPGHVLDGVRSLLLLGMNYRTAEPAAARAGQGRVSRYAWGVDYHVVIHDRLRQLGDLLQVQSPGCCVRGVVDTAPLLEREFASLAGLGWIGKNTLLLNKHAGSWFFLAALLTDAELEYDDPHVAEHCGTCRACLDACPTGALVQPYVLDSRRCISYLTIELRGMIPPELREGLGDWVFGCDICQEVCPWNHHAEGVARSEHGSEGRGNPGNHAHRIRALGRATQIVSQPRSDPNTNYQPAEGMNPLDLLPLFDLDDAAFRRRFRHTPLWRPKRRGILRNAAIVLGNYPTPAAVPALVRGLHDSEPLVRAACAWALGRFDDADSRRHLAARLAAEPDTAVREEIETSMCAKYAACGGPHSGPYHGPRM